MPSAGGLHPPVVVALNDNNSVNTNSKYNNINTDTYIEITSETPETKIFFTADGSKPKPHNEKFLADRSTFVYKGPFLMKKGRRIIKAIAVSRDGLKESSVVTKTFNVSETTTNATRNTNALGNNTPNNNPVNNSPIVNYNNTTNNNVIDENVFTRNNAFNDDYDDFNVLPTTATLQHPMTQINLYGFNSTPDLLNLYNNNLALPNNNENSLYNSFNNNDENFIGRLGNMTRRALDSAGQTRVGMEELRAIIRQEGSMLLNNHAMMEQLRQQQLQQLRQQQQLYRQQVSLQPALQLPQPQTMHQPQAYPQQPEQSYQQQPQQSQPKVVYVKEPTPPLLSCSPGNGDWEGQLAHICSHMTHKVTNQASLQNSLADYKFGKIKDMKIMGTGNKDEVEVRVLLRRIAGPLPPAPSLHPPMSFQQTGNMLKVANKAFNQSYAPRRNAGRKDDAVGKRLYGDEDEEKATTSNVFAKAFGGVMNVEDEEEFSNVNDPKTRDPFFETEKYEAQGTVVAYENFNAEEDCKVLKKAMKGFGTDEDAITDVLSQRSSLQRQNVVQSFKTMYGQDLIEELKSELSGNYLTCCKALCTKPAFYDASLIGKAVKGLGTDEAVLIEVLCSRTNKQIKAINKAYKQMFQKEMEKDIYDDTSGHFRRLMVSQCQGKREEGEQYDVTKVEEDVEALLQAGQKQWGTDEAVFNSILCSRSESHLRCLFRKYKEKSKGNKSIQESIADEFSGDIKASLLAVVNVIENKAAYFATRLHKAMKGAGTDDDALIRIVVTRCECDMVQIKEEFTRLFKGSLADWIKGDTSGDYRKILLALIGEA